MLDHALSGTGNHPRVHAPWGEPTPHGAREPWPIRVDLDGNTRLCTATAGEALKESFGADGQPDSHTDVDHCDVIALWGHNVAETQDVLWMRMLDRRRGSNPPRILCVDPRDAPVARERTCISRCGPARTSRCSTRCCTS